jgi:hypothetical protein
MLQCVNFVEARTLITATDGSLGSDSVGEQTLTYPLDAWMLRDKPRWHPSPNGVGKPDGFQFSLE